MKKLSIALKVAIPLSLLSFVTHSVRAADGVELTDSGLELTVTANRIEQQTSDALAAVSVITRNDIENIKAQDVTDVLRLQTGVDISRTGGPGSLTSVFLRGSSSQQVLVLIDGVRVSSATTGGFDWSGLPAAQIEKIEIVRGPRAALYGSDAIGGIIQIFTRKKSGVYISGTIGSFATKKLDLGLAKNLGKTDFSFNFSTEDARGFSATNERSGPFSFNPDTDGFRRNSFSGSLSHQFTDNTKAGLSLFYSDTDAEFDQGDSDFEVQTLSGFIESQLLDNWKTKLTISEARNDTVSASAFGTSVFDTTRREYNWQNDLTLSENTDFIVGLNRRETDADINGFNTFNGEITNNAIYANLLNRFGKVNLDLSARYDDHSQAGEDVTGQVAAGYSFTPNTNAYVSYGTAFRAPNINDLFNPGFPNFTDPSIFDFAGNPDLDPETSQTFEIGLKTNIGEYNRLNVNIFRTKVEDQVAFQGINSQLINLDETLLKGVELSLKGNTDKYDWALGATIQRAYDENTKERLIRRPNNKFTLDLGVKLSPKTRLGIDALFSSDRIDTDFSAFPAARVSLDSYSLVNLSLNHKITEKLSLGARIENVGDTTYENAIGFNTPRRSGFVTLSYKD